MKCNGQIVFGLRGFKTSRTPEERTLSTMWIFKFPSPPPNDLQKKSLLSAVCGLVVFTNPLAFQVRQEPCLCADIVTAAKYVFFALSRMDTPIYCKMLFRTISHNCYSLCLRECVNLLFCVCLLYKETGQVSLPNSSLHLRSQQRGRKFLRTECKAVQNSAKQCRRRCGEFPHFAHVWSCPPFPIAGFPPLLTGGGEGGEEEV